MALTIKGAPDRIVGPTQRGGTYLDILQKALEAALAAQRRGALELVILDMREVMTICDYFVICHGRSKVHCQALAEAVEEHLDRQGIPVAHREGVKDATWIILDYLDAVIHIFTEEARSFYDLRRLWAEAAEVEVPPAD